QEAEVRPAPPARPRNHARAARPIALSYADAHPDLASLRRGSQRVRPCIPGERTMHSTLARLAASDFPPLARKRLETLQVNLGYRCNQACLHCHVNAGPTRREMM